MTDLNTAITDCMKTAMREKDSTTLNALRALKTALQNARIAKGNVQAELSSAEEQAVIRKQLKQREDAITLYEQAGRTELADKEKAEITCLSSFLPEEMSEAQVAEVLAQVITELGATSKKDMGRVMKEMQARCEGRAPGKLLSSMVGASLS